MRVYLCDDELKMREAIAAEIAACFPEAEVEKFASGTALLSALQQKECDVLLLDIDMPELSGMEVASRLAELPKKPLLVFVTGHDELVYESFQYHPFGFVRKQFLHTELAKAVKDCVAELESKNRSFHFRTPEGETKVLLSEIQYFESEGNYLKLYTKMGTYRFRSTIGAVEARLAGDGFLRLHKGFLVNQEVVRLFGTEAVELTDGKMLPVGKTYGESAKQQFMRYLRS